MRLEDQAAYLQSLKEAAKLSAANPKEKLLLELVDTISLLCHQFYAMDAVVDGMGETLEAVQEQLAEGILESCDEEMGVVDYFDGQERPLYEVKCPQCGDKFAVDEVSLTKGFSCPTCGEHLIQAEA